MRGAQQVFVAAFLLGQTAHAIAQPVPIIPGFPTSIPAFADDFEFHCWAEPWAQKVQALPRPQFDLWMAQSSPEQKRLFRKAAVLNIDWYQKPEQKAAARKGRQCPWENEVAAKPTQAPIHSLSKQAEASAATPFVGPKSATECSALYDEINASIRQGKTVGRDHIAWAMRYEDAKNRYGLPCPVAESPKASIVRSYTVHGHYVERYADFSGNYARNWSFTVYPVPTAGDVEVGSVCGTTVYGNPKSFPDNALGRAGRGEYSTGDKVTDENGATVCGSISMKNFPVEQYGSKARQRSR